MGKGMWAKFFAHIGKGENAAGWRETGVGTQRVCPAVSFIFYNVFSREVKGIKV